MTKDEYWIAKTIDLALQNVREGGGPFACIIVRNGEQIARGVNRVVLNHDPTAHAEIQAMRNACSVLKHHQLDDCTIYTSCEPCPMCFGAIYWARPSKVVYAATKDDAANANFDDAFIYDELEESVSEKRTIPFIHVLTKRANEPFNFWNDWEAKSQY